MNPQSPLNRQIPEQNKEAELLAGLRAGHADSFENLLRTHSPRLLSTAIRILGNEADAQDAVQEALISAWKHIDKFEGNSSLSTWLHRIAVNACLAHLRTSQVKTEVALTDGESAINLAFEGLPSAWSEPGPNLEKRVAMRQTIQRALGLIPEEFRTVLLLRDVEEFSSREVAERLGISDASVRQRLHRARSTMAEILRPELCEGPALTCGGQFDLLMDYIDQQLPAELKGPVSEHVQGCETCRGLHTVYLQTVAWPKAVAELTALEEAPAPWLGITLEKGIRSLPLS